MTDIVQRLREAHADMRTGTREDLKDAADEIVRLRERLRETQAERDQWFIYSTE